MIYVINNTAYRRQLFLSKWGIIALIALKSTTTLYHSTVEVEVRILLQKIDWVEQGQGRDLSCSFSWRKTVELAGLHSTLCDGLTIF